MMNQMQINQMYQLMMMNQLAISQIEMNQMAVAMMMQILANNNQNLSHSSTSNNADNSNFDNKP